MTLPKMGPLPWASVSSQSTKGKVYVGGVTDLLK